MRTAVYPGSFDPITNGHLDVLQRSLGVFDHVILLLAVNPSKKGNFSIEERLEMMKEATKQFPHVSVDFNPGLTVDYCKSITRTILSVVFVPSLILNMNFNWPRLIALRDQISIWCSSCREGKRRLFPPPRLTRCN